MRISLNLATRPFADLGPALKQLRIVMAVFAVMALGLGLGLRAFHVKAEESRARAHSLDGAIARVNRERQGYEEMMRQPQNAELLTRVGTLNQLFDQKAFSWTLAMEDLETVLPGGVQVNSLEPIRDKEGHITLRLRVVGPRDKGIDLVRNLERSRRFVLPRITSENAESNGGPGERIEPVSASSRVNFDVLADYIPATEPRPRRASGKTSAGEEDVQERRTRPAYPVGNPTVPTLRSMPRPPYTGGPQPGGVLQHKPINPMDGRQP
jgi:type IV pilus assembly protein PilN